VDGRGSPEDEIAAVLDLLNGVLAGEVDLNVLGNDGPLTLDSLARRAEKLKLRTPWLTIFLDITADDKTALQLLDEAWSRWRVRVAFTADLGAEKWITDSERQDVAVHRVEEFTPRQIRRFLEKRDIDWRQIPSFLIEPPYERTLTPCSIRQSRRPKRTIKRRVSRTSTEAEPFLRTPSAGYNARP